MERLSSYEADRLNDALYGMDEGGNAQSRVSARFVRTDQDGTTWVRFEGADQDTPLTSAMFAMARQGDLIDVSLGGYEAFGGGNRTAPSASFQEVKAVSIEVENIRGKQANFERLTAKEIEAEKAKIGELEADTAKIHDLTADQLTATVGYIDDLTSRNITTENITADHGVINTLESNYAKIDLANVNNAWIQSGVIKDAAISDAQIIGVSANKLTAGTIDAGKINVANLRAKNLIVEKLNGQPVLGGYELVSQNSSGYASKNPSQEGWYEYSNGAWSASTDTVVDMSKAYYKDGGDVALYDQAYIDGMERTLNQRIDGAVETFTGTAVPSLVNYPAADWSASEYDSHVGDIYYVVNAGGQADGYSYRFTKMGAGSSATYDWTLIRDSDITKALQDILDINGALDIDSIIASDYTVYSFMTHTDGELSNLQTAQGNLETALGTKVSTTTFNEVKQAVDENSATITTMSETLTKGGRNLLKNSGLLTDAWTKESATVADGVATITKAASGNSRIYQMPANGYWTWEPGAKYVASIDAKTDTDGAQLGFQPVGGNVSYKNVALTTEWVRYEYAFTSGDNVTTGSMSFAVAGNTPAGTVIYVRKPKLELGSIATPWDSAPEDVTTISNTVNSVKQTATSNSSHISQLVTTLGTNADGTTKAGDIVHRVSDVVQDLDGFKSTVSATYATQTDMAARRKVTVLTTSTDFDTLTETGDYIVKASNNTNAPTTNWGKLSVDASGKTVQWWQPDASSKSWYRAKTNNTWSAWTETPTKGEFDTLGARVTQTETKITQTADAIGLTASGATTIANPNLTPWFSSMPLSTSGNTYWKYVSNLGTVTDMGDGWLRFQYTNSSGSAKRALEMACVLSPSIIPGGTYTWLVETRNNASTITGSGFIDAYLVQTNNNQFWGATAAKKLDDGSSSARSDMSLKLTESVNPVAGYIQRTKVAESASSGHWGGATEATNELARWNWNVADGVTVDAEFRVSLYEGEYTGPWKPYSGPQLYASQAELKVTNDNVSSKVSQTDYTGATVASLINQSADTVKIEAEHIEIDGTATFNAIKSKTDAAYDAKNAASTAVGNLKTDLASSSGTTVIDGGHITTGSIAIGTLDSSTQTKITNGNTALTKVNYYNRSCQVGQSTGTVSNPWYKFASCSITGTNIDYTIQFAVQAAGNYSDTKRDGTLRAHVRTGGTAGTFSSAQLEWLNRASGIELANFVLAYKATSGSKVDVELWCKVDTGWHGFQFFVEHEATRTGISSSALWTLYNNWGQDKSAASITSGYTQITSTDTDAARGVAENYIYADSSGIKIASASPSTQKQHLQLTSSDATFYDSGGTQRVKINSSNGVIVGNPAKGRAQLTDAGMTVYDTDGKVSLVTNASGVSLRRAGSKRAELTANGLDIYGSDGSTSIASFGETARVGATNVTNTRIGAGSLQVYKGDESDTSKKRVIVLGKASNDDQGVLMFYPDVGGQRMLISNPSDILSSVTLGSTSAAGYWAYLETLCTSGTASAALRACDTSGSPKANVYVNSNDGGYADITASEIRLNGTVKYSTDKDTVTIGDVMTAASGITIDNFHYVRRGHMATFYFRAKPSAAKSGSWDVGTLKTGFLPPLEAGAFTGTASHMAWILSTGVIRYNGSVAANAYAYVKATYLIA